MSFDETIARLAGGDLSDDTLAALSGLGTPELAQLADAWADIQPERRLSITTRMTEMADEDVSLDFAAVLKDRLSDPDAAVRCRAVNGLWECEDPWLVGPLVHLLHEDESAEVRVAAADALGRFAVLAEHGGLATGQAAMIAAGLQAVVADDRQSRETRCHALEAMAPLAMSEVRNAIGESRFSDDGMLALSALRAMGRSCDTTWLPSLLDDLANTDPEIRKAAALALGEMEGEDAVPALAELIYDEDAEVRLAAIQALGEIGGAEATEALQLCLADDNEAICQAAEDALDDASAGRDLEARDL